MCLSHVPGSDPLSGSMPTCDGLSLGSRPVLPPGLVESFNKLTNVKSRTHKVLGGGGEKRSRRMYRCDLTSSGQESRK